MPYLQNDNVALAQAEPEKVLDAFHKLVQDLSAALGPSSGLDSDDVNPGDIEKLMEGYISKQSEWLPYALGDNGRGYTRNLVDEGNGKSNLLILVWTPGKGSPIHDHANAHCVMKVLQGTLRESLYSWPEKDRVDGGESAPLQVTRQREYHENEVTYMSDKLGLHKISNPNPELPAVSLHLYTPPNAARFGCDVFEERTGRAHHVKQCDFFSRNGIKTE